MTLVIDDKEGAREDAREEYNRVVKRGIDQDAAEAILKGVPDGGVVKKWRLSAGLSLSDLGTLMGVTSRTVIRLEKDGKFTEKTLSALRRAVENADGLALPLPKKIRTYPVKPKYTDRYISVKHLTETQGSWRVCLNCGKTKWFYGTRQFCSGRCKIAHYRKYGPLDNRKKVVAVMKCAHCGEYTRFVRKQAVNVNKEDWDDAVQQIREKGGREPERTGEGDLGVRDGVAGHALDCELAGVPSERENSQDRA